MVLKDALLPLQKLIFETLNGDATLLAVLAGGVRGEVPQNPIFPYIRIGDHSETEFRTKSKSGSEITFFVHIFSELSGWLEAYTIKNLVDGLLGDTLSLKPDDFELTAIWRSGSTQLVESFEGVRKIRHLIPAYRAQMLQT